jgi:dienelactone hydrolase
MTIKKNIFIIILMGLLIVINGKKCLYAQQQKGAKGSDLFSVYTKKAITIRNITYRDMRLMHMKGLKTIFSLPDYTSLDQWKRHKQYIRRQILISAGLWPRPSKTPLHAHVFGEIKHKKYSVSKVYIEPYPNFYLAGNLYKPRGIKGPFPGMLMPHGHWKYGRLQNGNRVSVPGRCIHFAKAGYVVLSWDMVGYEDTKQIGHDFAEGDSLAKLWNINLFGLQLWDSMQALRFLRSLSSVDSTRIGITGASGGATQTYMLDAVVGSSKIKVSAPVNMISTIMQGGDLCENSPGLRLQDFNVEIAGAFAPRPQLMVSDTHDWTKNTPWAEYPMMQSIYKLYHATGHVKYVYFDYPHNYNKASREAVYRWFHKWMPSKRSPYLLKPESFTVDPDSDLLVFLKQPMPQSERDITFNQMDPSRYHNLPKGALQMDGATLKRYLKKMARRQLTAYWPKTKMEWARFDPVYGVAYRHIIADSIPKNVHGKMVAQGSEKGFRWQKLLIEQGHRHDWIPAVLFQPQVVKSKQAGVTLIITPGGKRGARNDKGTGPNKFVRQLLARGQSVMAIDVFKTGEHVLPLSVKTQRNENEQFFSTYNKTDTQQRIQDILTTGKYLKKTFPSNEINLLGLHRAGIWCLLTSPLASSLFTRVICDEYQLNPNRPSQWLPFIIPGLAKYDALQTALALDASHNTKVDIYNVNPAVDIQKIKKVYKMLGRSGNFSVIPEKPSAKNIISFFNSSSHYKFRAN